ncbi:DUF4132 domain-containing protein [Hymenobacter koreensis]|uniref:DUF4132 domain-containing protein n=1 Tax=Hymenobacter koreensis TaxID=1084523 RepID=A0ABP8JM33_9BACT
MQPILQEILTQSALYDTQYYELKLAGISTYQAIGNPTPAFKGRLALATAEAIQASWAPNQHTPYTTRAVLEALLQQLLRSALELTPDQFTRLFHLYGFDFEKKAGGLGGAFTRAPILLSLAQAEKFKKKHGLNEELMNYFTQLLEAAKKFDAGYGTTTIAKIRAKLEGMLEVKEAGALPTVRFPTGDALGRELNAFATALPAGTDATLPWLQLLQLWQKASGAQPTAKFNKEATAAVKNIGVEQVQEQAQQWLTLLVELTVEVKHRSHEYGNGTTYDYTEYHFLHEPSLNAAKGMVWTVAPLADSGMHQALADLAAKCHQKIPGQGPLAAGLGNACLLALSQGGLPGVAHLSRLRLKVRQTNTQELIGRYIEKVSQELGVTPAEIEDMAVPAGDLTDGRAEYHYGDYRATLQLRTGKAELQWQKAGKDLKAAPAALKQSHAAELKELKFQQTQAQQTFTTQRDRLDRSFVEERRMPFAWFRQYYLEHGLMSQLVKPLIWRFHYPDGSYHDALWLDAAWRDAHSQPIPGPTDDAQVQLWHPVLVSTEAVLAWRELLEQHQLRQPLKQAYREVYLLTPPEERTGTYSNRMAAHILKQHQFNSLAKLRGWKYSLLGAYDKGYESESAKLKLPRLGYQAEFWVNEVNADNAWNDTGIWNYVSTDQVRFTRTTDFDPIPLREVPPLVFSEVMRDVDLFVGVASVGNDPAWQDNGGLPAFRDYWHSYSFGELSEVAKTRKAVLERLVPRLKIGKVSEVQDKFLVVRGKLRSYKIHLGSGNILMSPNDQYLCIVPDNSKRNNAHDVFLPFEGDAVLSIIISKALLLADDDKITDTTITSQIGRGR